MISPSAARTVMPSLASRQPDGRTTSAGMLVLQTHVAAQIDTRSCKGASRLLKIKEKLHLEG